MRAELQRRFICHDQAAQPFGIASAVLKGPLLFYDSRSNNKNVSCGKGYPPVMKMGPLGLTNLAFFLITDQNSFSSF